jgi:diaminopimelate decarboxylase
VTGLDGHLTISDGRLYVEQVDTLDLVRAHRTPLHVVSEAQLRENYRRLDRAFRSRWFENDVRVHYSIKANPALAIRRVFSSEGAGGDCASLNELRATLTGGCEPARINLNGSNKERDAIRLAVAVGARINVDAPEELEVISEEVSRTGTTARVALRIKPDLREFGDLRSELRSDGRTIRDYARVNKWGLSLEMAADVIRRAGRLEGVVVEGVHYHLGRQIGQPLLFELVVPAVFRFVSALRRRTRWEPASVNLGGGFTQGRDPFGRRVRERAGGSIDAPPIEEWAERLVGSVREQLARHELSPPVLEFESGRFLVANAGVTLTRVDAVKRIGDRTWVGVDASVTHVGLSRSPADAHAVVLASPPRCGNATIVDVVGRLCVLDVLAQGVTLPTVGPGDYLALLDTGAYADSEASTSNLVPRPAVVLVDGARSDLIRVRETFGELVARDRIPERLGAPEPLAVSAAGSGSRLSRELADPQA